MSKLEVEDDQVTKDWELKCCVLWCRNEALGKEHLQNRVSGFFFLCSHCFGNKKKKVSKVTWATLQWVHIQGLDPWDVQITQLLFDDDDCNHDII